MKLLTLALAPLDTPLKRFGFLLLIAGSALLAYNLLFVDFGCCGSRGVVQRLWSAVTRDGYAYQRYRSGAWGVYLAAVGLLLSYLYDYSVGLLVWWVRHGKGE